MPYIRLTGSVRQVCENMIVIELDEDSKTKLQDTLDKLPDTTNVRTIHCSGSFAFKITNKTKITYNKCEKNESIENIKGYTIDVTSMYRYYKFTTDGVTTDGYSFVATHIRI